MLGFRALQALADLHAVAGRQPREAIRGISDQIPPADRDRGANTQALIRMLLRPGVRLERPADLPLLDALQLAASQSEANPAAFACATAILLSDRIQGGADRDVLGTYWDTLHESYTRLPSHDRAAIVQGFATAARLGRVAIRETMPASARTTELEESVYEALLSLCRNESGALWVAIAEAVGARMAKIVLPHLRMLMTGVRDVPLTGDCALFEPLLRIAANSEHPARITATALLLAEAIHAGDAEGWFAITLWSDNIRDWLELAPATGRTILAGLRHLYEADPDWTPIPDRLIDPSNMQGAALLPVLDASYSGGKTSGPVG